MTAADKCRLLSARIAETRRTTAPRAELDGTSDARFPPVADIHKYRAAHPAAKTVLPMTEKASHRARRPRLPSGIGAPWSPPSNSISDLTIGSLQASGWDYSA